RAVLLRHRGSREECDRRVARVAARRRRNPIGGVMRRAMLAVLAFACMAASPRQVVIRTAPIVIGSKPIEMTFDLSRYTKKRGQRVLEFQNVTAARQPGVIVSVFA